MVAALAIVAAFFYSISMVLTRIGLKSSNTLTGVLISLLASLFASFVASLYLVPLDHFATRAVLFFILSGLTGPCIARFLLLVGINRVGSAITSSLYSSKTLFSALAAVVLLSERFTLSIALGTVIIIIGSIIITLEESGGEIEKKWSKKDLIFPIASAACFGISYVFRKMGLSITPDPFLGAVMQNAAALAFFLLRTVAQQNKQRLVLNDKNAWIFFSLSGLSMVTAQLCVFYALELGEVVIVSPLSSITPFFVFLLVGIFLRDTERITWKILLGAVLIVVGTTVLTRVSSG
jgi:DME family drug/metabolite transporter